MAALSSALLCLAALGFVRGSRAPPYEGFRGRHFITAFLENGGSGDPNFQLNVSPPPQGPPTAVVVRARLAGAPPFRRALRLLPGAPGSLRLPDGVELRGSRRAAGSGVRLTASRPVGVTVVNARGRSSLDTALALPRHLLGTRYVVVTPALQPDDPHKEFAVVAGARPTSLRLTSLVPVRLDGVEHAARQPIRVHLEPFQALQVQSAGDLSGTRVVSSLPVALLAGHRCLHAGRKVCGHVSEQLLPQSRWGRVYAVPPFAPAVPGPRDHVYVVAGSPSKLHCWGSGAPKAHSLRPGAVLRLEVDPVRPLALRSSARLQVLFLAAAAARGGVAYDPFFALIPSVGAFSHSFALMAQPGFSNVAVLVAREPTAVFLDQRPLSALQWRLIPAGPEVHHRKRSNQSQAPAQGFAWTEVAFGDGRDALHRLETRGAPMGVLSFGTADGAGFGTQAMEQPTTESSLMRSPQFPVSCKGHVCSDGTTCHLVKRKPECVPRTQATSGSTTVSNPKTESWEDSQTVSIAGSETMAVAKPGSMNTRKAEVGLAQDPMKRPQPVATLQPAQAPVLQPMSRAEPGSTSMFKSKTALLSGPETVSVAKPQLKGLAMTEPSLQVETLPEFKVESLDKSDTAAASRKGQGASLGGTCWALGQPYIYTFDGYSFPVPGSCSYTLSHCPQALPSGLPAFRLWAACSGQGQPMHFVTLHVFGITIAAVKLEFGFVRVNQQRLQLPATLGNGRLRLYFHGSELWAEAGLEQQPPALRLVYDWQHALSLQVAGSYRAYVGGLCGNFNGDPADDAGGADPQAFLRAWALQPPEAPCHTLQAAPCTAPVPPLEAPGPCAILAALNGPFSQCHSVLPPTPFETSCRAWICPVPSSRPTLCLALQVYAHACQRLGVSVDSWRFQAGCPIDCPPNSHYEPCGSSCPETCVGPLGASCPLPCGETCACEAGYVRRGSACVLQGPGPHGCGCTHGGHLLAPGEVVWEGMGCARRCLCPASGGSVICTVPGCRPGERCTRSRGLPTCEPVGPATCVAADGGHYITFDGRHFRFPFPGSCEYLLSGLSTPAPDELPDFRVLLSTGPDHVPRSLEVHVPGFHLRLHPKEPGRALVNGDWQNLPFQAPGNSTVIFFRGWDMVVSCSFGLHVTYTPGIRVALALPAAYGDHVVGLCADYNGDPTDDLQVPGAMASPELPEDALAWAFGQHWLVGSPSGCLDAAGKMPPLPPSCVTLPKGGTPAHFPHVCDILLDSLGPFRLCHELLAPSPYFQDCMVGVCTGTGPCPMLSLYCETCQLLGGQVLPWRKPSLCNPTCPADAHYTLCAPSCPVTCAGLEPPAGCKDAGHCREGCVCNSGFVLSGATCVPATHCGCLSAGRYFEPGMPLPPLQPATSPCCRCHHGGRVSCSPCQEAPAGPGLCLAWGDLHYRTFDGTAFHLPGGACTYLLVGTDQGLLPGMWPFKVLLEKGPGVPEVRHVRLHAHSHHISLDCQDWGYLTVDNVRHCLPFVLARGRVRAFTQGESTMLVVPGGLWLLFGRDCHLSVGLAAAYRGLTQGLCGNFDGNVTDDLQLLRLGPCMAPRPCPGSICPTPAKDMGADTRQSACGLLLQPSGPLAPCHAHLPPEPFFQACVANLGRARGNSTMLCTWLQAYVAACHVAGASVHPWRKPGLCSMQCPPHSHYSLCVNPCPAACPGLLEVVQPPTPCAEGCECDEGFFPAGGDCVPAVSCSCFHEGQYFPPGQTVLIKNCSSSCSCQLGVGVTCVPFSCPAAEACAITDGVLGCRQQATLAPALNPVDPTLFFPPLLPGPQPQCPANSYFVPCGSACPATCANPSAPLHCSHPCTPTCQCLPGHLLLGDRCVPHTHCSCFLYQGRPFWTDNCTRHCHCPDLGPLASKVPQCWPDRCHGHCQVSTGGRQHCLLVQSPPSPPVLEEPLICTANGDFHFHTFGGVHYEFPGSCVYRLVGLCGKAQANLESFTMDLTPLLQPSGCTKALSLTACGLRLDMSPKDLNHIRVDGILESLPFFRGRCLRAYHQGYKLYIDTNFGLSLTYDWDSLVHVMLPRPYAPYLCGLCSPRATLPDTWKVAEVPGCSPVCGPLCSSPCPEAERTQFAGVTYCGLLSMAEGPLGPCYVVLDPLPFFNNCLDDVCRQNGAHSTVCRALASYSVACQALGIRLRPWRTPDFCPMHCPPHSHYTLCGPCCPATCAGGQVCEAGGASGGRCCEGCVCDAGFALSGASCVPAAQCGCSRAGRYRELGAVWYPGGSCARRCRCEPGGRVSCAPRPCGRGRVCGLRGGERRCLPDGRASCALAGPAHVLAFDGHAFTLPAPAAPARCLDVLARTARPGTWPFSLDVARDGTGPLRLNLHLAGRRLQLDRQVVGVITVDGEHCRLPWVLPGGQVWATSEGRHVVVHATCGLRLMYDWGSLVYLSVPSTFHGRLAGLCGAFGDDVDILDLPLDTGSWPTDLVATPCPLPQPNPSLSISCPSPLAQIIKAPKLCGLLQAPDGPFGRCLGHINPRPFLRMCLQDECHTQDKHLGLCDALTAYTAACQEAGIPVQPWRGPKLCPFTCPPRRHYSICAQICARGCVLPAAPAQCSTRCYEGCECEPGLIFDGTDCVSQDHCGCFHHGRYIPVGEALILPGCKEHCMCLRGQGPQCQPFSCPQGTDCILAGGMWSCEAGEGATCRLMPGGLFTTFDGFSGLAPVPVMPCAYDLATLVGSGPEDPDWFHVIADFPPCPGCTATQPWVIINFRDGCAAVGPNQEIWVNRSPAQLPARVCGGVMARWEEGSGVIIERTPTLRMLVGPEGAVALRASPTLQGRLRAACGDYNGVSADDLRLPGGLPGASMADVFQACRTQGFNSCTEILIPPAMT